MDHNNHVLCSTAALRTFLTLLISFLLSIWVDCCTKSDCWKTCSKYSKMFLKKVFLELRKQLCLRSVFLKLFTNYCPTEYTLDKYPYQSPSFQVWKLCGNAALQHSFGWITPNSARFSQKEIRLNFGILCEEPTYSSLVMH